MIPSDLTKDTKVSLKTMVGQLNYILGKLDDESQTENVLLQLKSVQAILSKTIFELLDVTYRKALAEKISIVHQNYPGNCGNEDEIEKLRNLFPEFSLEDIPKRLEEAKKLKIQLQNYISAKD